MPRSLLVLLIVLVVGVLARLSLYTVDRSEFVYVTQFGRHVATFDGANEKEAGLHIKWPWPIESVQRIDRRLQFFDLPPAELVTKDPREGETIDRTLTIDAYVCWRIPDAAAVENYIKTVGTLDRARENLRDRIRAGLGAEIAGRKLEELISDQPGQVEKKWEEMRTSLLERARRSAERDSLINKGIEIVDIRIRRLNYPPQVRDAIFERIISERNKKVAYYQAEGRREAERIRSESEATISMLRDKVEAENKEKRGAGEKAADRIRLNAFSKDPEYYAELKRQEVGMAGVDSKTKVWSTRLFELFFPLPGSRSPASGSGGTVPGGPPVRPQGGN